MSSCVATLDVIVQAPVVLEITPPPVVTLDVATSGVQGPPGPPAPSFTYVHGGPSDVWTVAHNLGFRPAVSIITVGGLEMMGNVQHLSENTLQITFTQNVAGTARLN